MNQDFRSEKELVERIGALPRSIPPRHDLWPDIERQLEDRQRVSRDRPTSSGWRITAVAAGLMVAFATGILLGRQLEQGPSVNPQDPALSNRALLATIQASEREYQAAFRQFTPIDSTRVALAPQAIQSIEGSWQELLQAEAALLTALEEHPENAYLNQRLLDLRARQLQFMKQVVTLDSSSRRKI